MSKGRFYNPKTAFVLDGMGIEYKICVEPLEVDEYKKRVCASRVLALPENFSLNGQGSIPARNWIFENAVELGHKKHWILDDNIEGFNRLNKNTKFLVKSDATFRASEDFVDRYENIALSGMNYYSFAKANDNVPPYYLNTRIYSCILINHEIPFRWRGKYNEDTDLALRCLKAGWNTILFNAFLCGKISSMRNKGGNTDTIYNNGDNRMEFAKHLQRQHPDVASIVFRFNRWHHHVNYQSFKNRRLVRKKNITIQRGVNNYGMVLNNLE